MSTKTGKDVELGEAGELLVRGPQVQILWYLHLLLRQSVFIMQIIFALIDIASDETKMLKRRMAPGIYGRPFSGIVEPCECLENLC